MSNNISLVIFIYGAMNVGGIETYMFRQMRELLANDVKIVWVMSKAGTVDPVYSEVVYSKGITIFEEKINYKQLNEIIIENNIEDIKIISFSPFKFIIGEQIKNKLKGVNVDNFYFVPHFEGEDYYIEDRFKGRKAQNIRARMKKIFEKMNSNGNIRYFARKHIERMSETYDLDIDDYDITRVPQVKSEQIEFDAERIRKIYQRDRFNILTVSRLEFPHKGFMLGLTREFFKLKKKYPQLELTIVGDGPGRCELENEIAKNGELAESVKLIGTVSPDKLGDFYDDANINISVAGCFFKGAERGVLSCPARHYTYECEVYGFSSEDKQYSVDDAPGQPVVDYIEKTIAMTEEEYIEHCYNTFKIYQRINKEREKTKGILDIVNKESTTISKSDIRFIYRHRITIFEVYKNIIKKEGFFRPAIRKIKKAFRLA